MLACPSDAELVELVEGRLAGSALARLQEHVARCSACAAILAGLAPNEGRTETRPSGLDLEVARSLVAETTPRRPPRPR
jgi:hypothetical protein